MKDVLYIENQKLDLNANTIIALSYQFFSSRNVASRFVSYSNRFKVPVTRNNDLILGHCRLVDSKSNVPYIRLNAKLVRGGTELPGMLATVTFDGSNYIIGLSDKTISFFEQIKNKTIDEVETGLDFVTMDQDYIDDYYNNYTPFAAPVIDYGALFATDPGVQNKTFIGNWFTTTNQWSPWESVSRGAGSVDWDITLGLGRPEVELYGGKKSFWSTQKNIKVFSGYRYKLKFTFEHDWSPTGTRNVWMYAILENDDGTLSQDLSPVSTYNTEGVFVYEISFTSSQDFTKIKLGAEHVLGETGTVFVTLLSFEINPDLSVIDIKPEFYVPMINYKTIVTSIISNAGFGSGGLSATNSGLNNTNFQQLAIPFSKGSYGYEEPFLRKYRLDARATGLQAIAANDNTARDIEFSDVLFIGSKNYFDGTSRYNLPASDYLNMKVKFKIKVQVTLAVANELYFRLRWPSLTTLGKAITSSGTHEFTIEAPIHAIGGSVVSYYLTAERSLGASAYTCDIISGQMSVEIDSKPATKVDVAGFILPTMSQETFIKDFLIRYGAIMKEKNGLIETKTLESIISDRRNAYDWTSKRIKVPDSMDFTGDGYAQLNILRDTDDDTSEVGFNVPNERLEESKVFYQSPFKLVKLVSNTAGLDICSVPIWSAESANVYEFDENWEEGIRLVYLRSPTGDEPTVKYNGVTKFDYYIAVYDSPLEPVNASWKYQVENFYKSLQQSLEQVKDPIRYYDLSDDDIASIDLFRLVYDDGQYYLIEKIFESVSGRPTKVKLLRVR